MIRTIKSAMVAVSVFLVVAACGPTMHQAAFVRLPIDSSESEYRLALEASVIDPEAVPSETKVHDRIDVHIYRAVASPTTVLLIRFNGDLPVSMDEFRDRSLTKSHSFIYGSEGLEWVRSRDLQLDSEHYWHVDWESDELAFMVEYDATGSPTGRFTDTSIGPENELVTILYSSGNEIQSGVRIVQLDEDRFRAWVSDSEGRLVASQFEGPSGIHRSVYLLTEGDLPLIINPPVSAISYSHTTAQMGLGQDIVWVYERDISMNDWSDMDTVFDRIEAPGFFDEPEHDDHDHDHEGD